MDYRQSSSRKPLLRESYRQTGNYTCFVNFRSATRTNRTSAAKVVSLSNRRMFRAEACCLFECVRHLQNTEVLFVASNDLQAYRKTFGGKAGRDRGGRVSCG